MMASPAPVRERFQQPHARIEPSRGQQGVPVPPGGVPQFVIPNAPRFGANSGAISGDRPPSGLPGIVTDASARSDPGEALRSFLNPQGPYPGIPRPSGNPPPGLKEAIDLFKGMKPPPPGQNKIISGLNKAGELVDKTFNNFATNLGQGALDVLGESFNRAGKSITDQSAAINAPVYSNYPAPNVVNRVHRSDGNINVTGISEVPDGGTDWVVTNPDGTTTTTPRSRVTAVSPIGKAGRYIKAGLTGALEVAQLPAQGVERTFIGPLGQNAAMPPKPIALPNGVSYVPPSLQFTTAGASTGESFSSAVHRTYPASPQLEKAISDTNRIAYSGPEARLRAVGRILGGEEVESVLYGDGGYVTSHLMDLGWADDPLRAIKADPLTSYYYDRRSVELKAQGKSEQEANDQIVSEIATKGLPGESNVGAEATGQAILDPLNFIGEIGDAAHTASQVAEAKRWYGVPQSLDTSLNILRKEYNPALEVAGKSIPLDWMPHVSTPTAVLAKTSTLASDGANATAMVIAENAAHLGPEARQAQTLLQLQAYVDLAAPKPILSDFIEAARLAPEGLLKATPEELLAEAVTKWEAKQLKAQSALALVDVAHSGAGQLGAGVVRQLITDDSGKITKAITESIQSGKSSGEVLHEVMSGVNDASLNLLQPTRKGARNIKQFVEMGNKAQDFPIFEKGLFGQVERATLAETAAKQGIKYDISPITRGIGASSWLRHQVDNQLWTVFARLSPQYTIRNAINGFTTAVVDRKLAMAATEEVDNLLSLTGSPLAANKGIGQGAQTGQAVGEGFWKGGFAGEFKVGNIPVGAQAVEKAFSRDIWYSGAKQYLDRQMVLGKAIPNLPPGVELRMTEDAVRQFTHMVASAHGDPTEAMTWLKNTFAKQPGGEAELWRILDNEDFQLLHAHDPELAKKVQTLLRKAGSESDLRAGMHGLRGTTASKLKRIDDSIPLAIDGNDPQWLEIGADTKLAQESGITLPPDFEKKLNLQQEYSDAARGNAFDALKAKDTVTKEELTAFTKREEEATALSLQTRTTHKALRETTLKSELGIKATMKDPTRRQLLLDALWEDYFASRDELWTKFRHEVTDGWDQYRAQVTDTDYVPRRYSDNPLPRVRSTTDIYAPTASPRTNAQILRDYAQMPDREFPIATATTAGRPLDAQLLNALNKEQYRTAAGLTDITPFTRKEIAQGLSAERLQQAQSILDSRWTVKLSGGQMPPAVIEAQAGEAAFRASPEAKTALRSATLQAKEGANVSVRDLNRLFNRNGTPKAWEANNPGRWLEQAHDLFARGGWDIPEDANRAFFENLASHQYENVNAAKTLQGAQTERLFPNAPAVAPRQGPAITGLGEPTAAGIGGELPNIPQPTVNVGPAIPRLGTGDLGPFTGEFPLAAQGPAVPRLGEAVSVDNVPTIGNVQTSFPNVHLPPNDPHSLTGVLDRIQSKAINTWGKTAPHTMDGIDWNLMDAWAEQATRSGQQHRIIAGQVGAQARDFALLNYSDRRNIDSWLGMVFPYMYWPSRTAKNWATRFATNPAAMANYGRYRSSLDQLHAALPEYQRQQLSTEDLGIPLDNPQMFNLEQTMSPLYGLLGSDYSDEQRRRAKLAGIDNVGGLVEDASGLSSVWAPIIWAMVLENARSDPEAAMAWGNNYLGTGFRAARAATTLAGEAGVPGIPPGGLNLDPQMIATNMAVGNGLSTQNMTKWERDALAVKFGTLTNSPPPPGVDALDWKAQVQSAGYTESGPIFDKMLQELMVGTAPAVLTSFGLGLGFKPRGKDQIEIANIWGELASIRSHYDDYSPEQIALAYNDLERRHPGYDSLVLLRASGPERDDQWAWEAVSRVGVGYSDAWKAAGVSQAAWDNFYKVKTTAAMEPALRDELMMGINAVNSIARPTTVEEARQQIAARNTYKQIDAQLKREFGTETLALQDQYFQIRDQQGKDAATEFLAQLPPDSPLYALWDKRNQLLSADPLASRYYLDPERYKSYLTSQWYDTQDPQLVEAARLYTEYNNAGDFKSKKALLALYPGLKPFWKEREVFYDALPGEVSTWLDGLPKAEQFNLRADVTPMTQLQKNLAGVKAKEEAMFNPPPEETLPGGTGTGGQSDLRTQIEAQVAQQDNVEVKKNGYLTTDNKNIYETTLYEAIIKQANGNPQLAEQMFTATHSQGWQVYNSLNSPDELIAYAAGSGTGQLREKLLTDTSTNWTSALAFIRTLDPQTIAQLKQTIPDIEVIYQHALGWDAGPSEQARADIVGLKVTFNLDGSMSMSRISNKKYYGEEAGDTTDVGGTRGATHTRRSRSGYAATGSYTADVGSKTTKRGKGKKSSSSLASLDNEQPTRPFDWNKYQGGEGPTLRGHPRGGGGHGGRGGSGGSSVNEGAYPAPADVGAWTSFVQAMGATPLMITHLSDYFDSDQFTRDAMLQRYPDLAELVNKLGAKLATLEQAYLAWVSGRRPASGRGGRGGNVSASLLRVYKKRGGKSGLV